MRKYCEECEKEHDDDVFCIKCGACLYKNGKPYGGGPDSSTGDRWNQLHSCTKCGTTNFIE